MRLSRMRPEPVEGAKVAPFDRLRAHFDRIRAHFDRRRERSSADSERQGRLHHVRQAAGNLVGSLIALRLHHDPHQRLRARGA